MFLTVIKSHLLSLPIIKPHKYISILIPWSLVPKQVFPNRKLFLLKNLQSSSLPIENALPTLPLNYKTALKDDAWYNTMDLENSALKSKTTWFLVPQDPSQKMISNKWVFRVTKADDTLDKLKARLVARGFEQLAGIDYLETFSPMVKFSTICLVFV